MRLAALAAVLVLTARAPEAAAAEPFGEEPVVFRWTDARGNAHDTTDATSIPPGVKIRVRNPDFPGGDLEKKRSWWRARRARLLAELHSLHDRRAAAEAALAEAVRTGVPVADREPYREKIREAEAAAQRAQQALTDLDDEAKKKRIPARWLQ